MTESTTEPDATTRLRDEQPPADPTDNVDRPPAAAIDVGNDRPIRDEVEPNDVAGDAVEPAAVEAAPDVDDTTALWVDGEPPETLSYAVDSAALDSSEPAEDAADAEDAEATDAEEGAVSGEALLVQEGEIAGDYLEQLLDILDYDGDIDLDVEGSRAIVAIVGANDLDPLVGARGVTLDALQELTRLTVAQQTGVRTRLMLDVGGYRAGRRTELSALAATTVARVIESRETVRMTPMNAFERKIVHDVVTATDGVCSESEGEDPDRRVVILPDR